MRILLVDGHAGMRQVWRELLESLGYQVTGCAEPASAWDVFQSDPHPLVLIDLSLRGSSVLGLCRQIRSIPSGDGTIIFAAAGRDDTASIHAALAAGANDYIRKPVDATLLEVRLAVAAQQSRQLVERQRIEEELRKRLDQVRAVYQLADATSHAHAIEDVYAEALEALERALRTRRAAIVLFDDQGVMRFLAWQGISERYRQAVEGHSPWARDDPDPQPIVVDAVESDPRTASHRDAILEEGIRSLVFVPLRYRGELLGKFMIYHGAPHETSDEEVQLAQVIASHVASAVGRARAAEALRASEERFRQLAENIDAVFWIAAVGARGMLYMSPAYEDIWGRPRDAVLADAMAAIEAVHPDDRARVREMRKRRALGDMSEHEYRIARPDGTVRWIRGRAFPVRDDQGEMYRVAGIAEDVTREKQLEEQLMQSERLSAAGMLVGGIAHQLNNPLTGMLGFSQLLLRNTALEGKVRSSIERIHEEALRAKQIVSRLLAFARHARPRFELLDVNAVIASALELTSEECRMRDIAVGTALAADLPATQADRQQLRQLFVSLFANAMHAMQGANGTAALRIASTLNERGRIEVRVSDTGPGVPLELRRKIFDPFFTTKDERDGTGLGLSVVFAIVQDHQGEILVTDSEPPPGATFVVELPVCDRPPASADPAAP